MKLRADLFPWCFFQSVIFLIIWRFYWVSWGANSFFNEYAVSTIILLLMTKHLYVGLPLDVDGCRVGDGQTCYREERTYQEKLVHPTIEKNR
jgi:hypothetical protein